MNRAYTSIHSEATISTTAPYAAVVARFVSFDAAGRISRQVEGNGYLGREYTYDGLGRLFTDSAITVVDTAQGNPCTGDPPPDVDENGNLCTYDDPPGFWRVDSGHTYAYDAVGNRIDQGGDYALGNRIRQLAGCTYVTDSLGDGNVLSRTCGTQTVRFHWTAESRLKALQIVGGDSVDFRYDASGRLVRRDSSGVAKAYFLWQGDNLLAELTANATGKVAEYSYYPGLDNLHALITGTTPYFAHADGIGNVIALTDSATKRVRRWYDYDDWGTLTGGGDSLPFTNADRARFKGALWLGPQVELYYMRARWYEPKSGRFLSEDPIGLRGGINRYTYAGDDPVNGRDPSGLWECLLLIVDGEKIPCDDPRYDAWLDAADVWLATNYGIGLAAALHTGGFWGSAPRPKQCPGGPTQWPIVGGSKYVTSGFRDREGRPTGSSNPHGGIDLGVPNGTAVNPMAAGVIAGAWQSSDGLVVEINHGGGFTSRYRHLSAVNGVANSSVVFIGDRVHLASVLGWTGWAPPPATGPNLHFELRYQNKAVDPTPCLP